MGEKITRERFSVWADNKIVNFLEDYGDVIYNSVSGRYVVENEDYSITCNWGITNNGMITISIRAYVEQTGWQTLEHNLQHNKQ